MFRPMKSICNEIGELPLVEDGGFSGQANRMYCGWGHRGQHNTNAASCSTVFVVIHPFGSEGSGGGPGNELRTGRGCWKRVVEGCAY